ncbi:MAG: class I SAM-dependent DNA methyltransferase [Pseudomonadota bacterium]
MHGTPDRTDAFIARWSKATGNELANYQLFLTELTELLGLPRPEPAGAEHRDNAYVFERGVTFRHGDGSSSSGRIDLYRRGAFVCECKRIKGPEAAKGFDDALLRARSQAEAYARALPADEGRPPFRVGVDVGRVIELYAEFSRSGATYVPFPDPRSHRIPLDALRDPAIRERLAGVWTDPLSLDPTRRSAKVTREIAARLAEVAKSLESAGHPAEAVAAFLSRCLFTFFAEDIGLLPKDGFRALLEKHVDDPATAMRMVSALWREMDSGGFSVSLAVPVLRFNGKLFKQPDVLPLTRAQIVLLIDAAKAQWSEVEPAIFGTLLERALDPDERHALGAHYTPRAYVERLVLPTVIEPLREDWADAKAAALTLAREDDLDGALAALKDFHRALCAVRVLDPACGSGNFLYVTLEHLKRLEGEVLNTFDDLDPERRSAKQRQQGLALEGGRADPFGGETVDPHQLLGIEVNPRAAAIAEMVLWIGYLQWHYRTRGNVNPPEPVLRDFRNIECRDAVLAWDRIEYVTDEHGKPVTRWDGKTMKTSPVTGEPIPDDSVRVPVERYVNPRKAEWPAAEFVVGNPPFIGKGAIRLALGDGYVDALRATWLDVADSADFVMYWWAEASRLVAAGSLRRFGLITTNSISQAFNRRVIESALAADAKPFSIVFAVPDHPWVESAGGAAVRIAMTIGARTPASGVVLDATRESDGMDGETTVEFRRTTGTINSRLRVGADVGRTASLRANASISSTGLILGSRGFVVSLTERDRLCSAGGGEILFPLRNGDDLLGLCRNVYVIDTHGRTEQDLRMKSPAIWQHLHDRVYPERQQNRDPKLRSEWWLHRRSNEQVRGAISGLNRYIATVETAKHRVFQMIDGRVRPEHVLIVIGINDYAPLAVLQSRVHLVWALATGGTLEDRPRYNKTKCFETFPFPEAAKESPNSLRAVGQAVDEHRSRQQTLNPSLELRDAYNVLEKLRRDEPLTAKERVIHDQGLVSVLRELHDDLDRAVFAAYGWEDLGERLVGKPGATTPWPEKPAEQAEAEEELLSRLVALNAERAAEEARGIVRWLRPEFQNPQATERAAVQDPLPMAESEEDGEAGEGEKHRGARAAPTKRGGVATSGKAGRRGTATASAGEGDGSAGATSGAVDDRLPWPKTAPEQARAVADVLAATRSPLSLDDIAARFTARGRWRDRLPQLLDTLAALGRARRDGERWWGA